MDRHFIKLKIFFNRIGKNFNIILSRPYFFEITWMQKEYQKKRFLLLSFLCAIKKEFFHLCMRNVIVIVYPTRYNFEKEVLLGKLFLKKE